MSGEEITVGEVTDHGDRGYPRGVFHILATDACFQNQDDWR